MTHQTEPYLPTVAPNETDDLDEDVLVGDQAEEIGFKKLGLDELLVRSVVDSGYEVPTPIQEQTIPSLLAGHDLIGQAQTGTGKTAAYALPLLQKLSPDRHVQALVLTPTRELAIQVSDAIRKFARHMGRVRILPIYGGQAMSIQMSALRKGVQVVVGTPGRVLDLLGRGVLVFDGVHTIVLDEADEMLHMGFIDDVEAILAQTPERSSVQMALFSATMPPEIRRIAAQHLESPVTVEIVDETRTIAAVDQRYIVVHRDDKFEVLNRILEVEKSGAILIFTATRVACSQLAETLVEGGQAAEALHGDMSQSQRELVLKRLRSGRTRIVVATDVAARGLDVDSITHVINFDAPREPENYLHRIGRTGRAGRGGVALLFILPRERGLIVHIERYTRSKLQEMASPSLVQVRAARIDTFKAEIREALQSEELEVYVELVRDIAKEEQCDINRVAAALARMLRKDLDLQPPELESVHDGGVVYLALSLGRWDGLRAGDVVGSIANEIGLPGKAIGPIIILERVTLVGVPSHASRHVLSELASIRGRLVRVRLASEAERRLCESKNTRASRDHQQTARAGRTGYVKTPNHRNHHRGQGENRGAQIARKKQIGSGFKKGRINRPNSPKKK